MVPLAVANMKVHGGLQVVQVGFIGYQPEGSFPKGNRP